MQTNRSQNNIINKKEKTTNLPHLEKKKPKGIVFVCASLLKKII